MPGTSVEVITDGKTEVTYPYITAAIAATHTGFNIANVLIFIPLMGLYTGVLKKLVPDKHPGAPSHLTYFDMHMVTTPHWVCSSPKKRFY